MKVQSIYTNRFVKKGLKFAADNGSLFVASASLALSTVARPLSIMATPNTDKQNKKYACAKSLASSVAGYMVMLVSSIPLAKAIKNIDENPHEYLKATTIKNLKNSEKELKSSSKYKFATQLFKLGLGFVIAAPKSILTCALIPPFMKKVFSKKEATPQHQKKNVSFTGMEGLSKRIGKIIDTSTVQKLTDKLHNTNYEFNMMALTDIIATGIFMHQTAKSKGIEQDRKKALMYNSAISTGLCVGGGYLIDKMSEKSTKNFIEKFAEANKKSPNLGKYIEGIKIVKPAMIFGVMYYVFIPIISTFLADRFDGNKYISTKNK